MIDLELNQFTGLINLKIVQFEINDLLHNSHKYQQNNYVYCSDSTCRYTEPVLRTPRLMDWISA